jgi:hypothetical protein
MIQLPPGFKDFLKLLHEKQVEYLLIGGYAVAYHGYARATADMDIWVRSDHENAVKLVTCVQEFGFDVPNLSPILFLEPDKIIRMGHPPIRIKILTTISGLDFADSYRKHLEIEVNGCPVNMIDIDSLKSNKKASGRYKDLNDLEHLP